MITGRECDRCGVSVPANEGRVFVAVEWDRPGDRLDVGTGRTTPRADLVGPCCSKGGE